MKQKTRYNIRLAERKGVKIRNATKKELGQIYEMYARTSLRDGFTIRSKDYYLMVWEKFMDAGMCEILIAEVEQQMVAGLVLFLFEDKAYYVYGMSGELYRNYMPTYLLQYEAIKRAKSRGCNVYDLWGAPDNFSKSDPMWGVFRFKKGLGGEVVSTLGAWDFPVRPLQMKLFQIILPKILEKMRKIGNRKTSESVSSL